MAPFESSMKCAACGMEFANQAEMQRHSAAHASPEVRAPPSCAACGMTFRDDAEFRGHNRQVHGM